MNEKTTYYLIWKHLVGKKEDEMFYLFKNGEWIPDKENVIMDHLMGYDPTEPPGSPYAIYNMSIMDEIEDISYEEAMKIIGEQK
jgi:hypothetical protein